MSCVGVEKKNREKLVQEEREKSGYLDLKTPEAKDKLAILDAATQDSSQANQNTQSIKDYLSDLDNIRKDNQLVYGKKLEEDNLSLGLGLVCFEEKTQVPLFKKAMKSTLLSVFPMGQGTGMGAVEFGVTYDNEIFLVSIPNSSAKNLYKMAQGTLLKALGCIQIGNIKVKKNIDGVPRSKILAGQVEYISVYNPFFEVPQNNIAISLFALKNLHLDLSGTKVVVPDDNFPFISVLSGCHITIRGKIQDAEYYLNETRFPGAKKLAKKQLTLFDKLIEIFCIIDDEILIKKDKSFTTDPYDKKEFLKLNLIKLFNCVEINKTVKKVTENKTTKKIEVIGQANTLSESVDNQAPKFGANTENTSESFKDYWQHIKACIEFFKENKVDLSFLLYEINMILAYLLKGSLTLEEKKQLKEWATLEKMPGRGLDKEDISDYANYLRFYEQNPVKTCINLLKDYSKGSGWQGMICRFFSGAWNRNYKDSVNKFLIIYNTNELPDNITICSIYKKLKELGLIFNYDASSKSSLRKILLFCAKLNNEEEALLHLINTSLTFFPPFRS